MRPTQPEPNVKGQRFCWSEAISWAWEDLNLRPHPYQLTAGNRCADSPFPRSPLTVGVVVIGSIGVQLCVLLSGLYLAQLHGHQHLTRASPLLQAERVTPACWATKRPGCCSAG
jgi:hypothetical protein